MCLVSYYEFNNYNINGKIMLKKIEIKYKEPEKMNSFEKNYLNHN